MSKSHTAWSKGFYLWQAPKVFALQADKKRLIELEHSMEGKSPFLSMLANVAGKPEAIPSERRVSIEDYDELQKLREKLQSQLVNWIREGKLLAYGYAIPRRPEDAPCKIPDDLWRFSPNFENSSIGGNGLRIDAIRILHPNWMPKAPPMLPEKAPKPGRPSKRDLIQLAYQECLASGRVSRDLSIRQACARVAQWIQENRPAEYEGGKGLALQAVRNVIREPFQALKG